MLANMKIAVETSVGIGLVSALMVATVAVGMARLETMAPVLGADMGRNGVPETMDRLEDLIYLPGGKALFA